MLKTLYNLLTNNKIQYYFMVKENKLCPNFSVKSLEGPNNRRYTSKYE